MATLVEIVPYDQNWPRLFSAAESKLRQLLGSMAVGIDHIGSTSIPAMPAKPILDIDITLRGLSDVPIASAILTSAGYQPRGNRYHDDVWAFMKHDSVPKQRVYLCPPENETHMRRVIFRDYLRAHADIAEAYSSLKMQLARRFPYDGDRYTAEKSGFITEIVRLAQPAVSGSGAATSTGWSTNS
ncbi:GrpB family protein [Pleomorphomonas carboxyditropha]|uniref:GrpB family protein n=1 Tax=Pleomorphomonas carboxyditropha TaxID=2023338 RepID=A0A2G9WVU0_9HYPH|nr:GrpB family protein [Pleomorphomonas carboxyditropha]PIO98794.1 hypothetical protein CJ014_13930 [Pleomorphomonas carboxyditropha]